MAIRNPWGKASGQLSLNRKQIEEAAEARLGLVVLKTVIAQDAQGRQSMSAWAIKESQMVPEPISSPATGAQGWTITWKGRGWWQSFADYLELVRAGSEIAQGSNLLVVPSVKYHLPAAGEATWREEEYRETTHALLAAYQSSAGPVVMPLEKDFSPTLAGSDRATQRAIVVEWLRRVPGLIRSATTDVGCLRVGLKLFNSLDDDDFQLAMLAEVHGETRPDYLVYANRLFDPDRVFEGQRGVAYGGPDLSDRNLRLLSTLRRGQRRAKSRDLPWRSVRPATSARAGLPWSTLFGAVRASRFIPCFSSLRLSTRCASGPRCKERCTASTSTPRTVSSSGCSTRPANWTCPVMASSGSWTWPDVGRVQL